MLGHIASAVDAGASAVLVTCSSIGAAAELARQVVPVPVIRVDEAMADEAVRIGPRIRATARQDRSTALGLSTGNIHATSPGPPEQYSEARHLAEITTSPEGAANSAGRCKMSEPTRWADSASLAAPLLRQRPALPFALNDRY